MVVVLLAEVLALTWADDIDDDRHGATIVGNDEGDVIR